MKKIAVLLFLGVLLFLLMSGCRVVKIEEEERTPVPYAIVEKEEIPQQLKALIEEKKEQEFQLTYQMGKELYLVKGYGRQLCGGYSIQVEELGFSNNTLFFKTMLIGPDGEEHNSVPSYPYIVVKTEQRKCIVLFE